MKKKQQERSMTKNILEKSGNLSMMADYIVGETLGNGNILETQQNLRMCIQSSDQNSSQLQLSSFNSNSSINSNKINKNNVFGVVEKNLQIEKPNFGKLQNHIAALHSGDVGEANQDFLKFLKMAAGASFLILIVNIPEIINEF